MLKKNVLKVVGEGFPPVNWDETVSAGKFPVGNGEFIDNCVLNLDATKESFDTGENVKIAQDFSLSGNLAVQDTVSQQPEYHRYSDEIVNVVRRENAISFTGTNSYAKINNSSGLSIQEIKIKFFLKTITNGKDIVNKGIGGQDNYCVGITNEKIRFFGYNTDGSAKGFTSGTGNTIVTDGKWHKVECTFDGVDYWEIKIDDVVDATKTHAIDVPLNENTNNLVIGARGVSTGSYIGELRDLKIYDGDTLVLERDLKSSDGLDVTVGVTYPQQSIIPASFVFDGVDDYIKTDVQPNKEEGAIFIVADIFTHRNYNTLFGQSNNSNEWEMWGYGNGTFRVRASGGETVVSPVISTGIHIFSVIWDSNGLSFYIDGVLIGSDTYETRPVFADLYIGGGAGNTTIDGAIPQVILKGNTPTDTERKKIETKLSQDYGIPLLS